jgi:diguanylate cyclase (GGDEF)-like protein
MSSTKSDTIPKDVYVQFIRSLYDNVHVILIGAACHAVMTFLSYWTTGAPVYLGLCVLLAGLGVWRYVSMSRVVQQFLVVDYESAKRCERHYVLQGSLQGLALGGYCFIAIYVVPDAFSELAAVAVTMGSMVTVAGRNYGSRNMVAIFAVTFIVPISLALILRWDLPNVALGLLVFPFLFVVKGTADQVRYVLFSAVIGHKQAKQIAQRFDRALNTMSHGLVMVDASSTVIVANSEAAAMLGLRSAERLIGRTLNSLLMRGVAAGLLDAKDCQYVEAQLGRALRDRRDRKLLVSFADGRHIEFSAREGSNDLGVITFEDVTARITAEERIRFMARFDSLTGLPNRAYFHELVTEFMSAGDPKRLCALIIVDLDDFKSVNDTLGHPIGDGLIYAVGSKLSEFAGEHVKVSRFGGDEFVLFFDHLEDEQQLVERLEEILQRVSGEVDVAGHLLRMQVSAGAVMSQVDRTDVDGMFVKADLALYKAKEQGKNGWRIFENAMDDAFRNRQLMKADLRNAIAGDKLRVVYQPIVSLKTMRIDGCEALCRWDHPELGAISPAVFIPLAEEMGIISDISVFVLNTACRECMKWPDPISVSVNLSARDFRSRNIVEQVRVALQTSGLAPRRLEIEVTETALLDDKALTRHYLEDLKDLGVRIALDDFGTGYSSLSYLHTLPLDKIKIDRSFIMDLTENDRSLTLLTGIVNLSRPLGLEVTVEGVETFDQLRILSETVAPDLLQGFLFGSPLPASAIATIATSMWPFGKDLGGASGPAKRVGFGASF